MKPLFLHTNQTKNTTILQNQFIDHYMASASGEYVKLYLYLLRCAQAGEEISFTMIADLLDHTEKDIKRALAYWEKLGLLYLTKNENGWITDITFLDIPPIEKPIEVKQEPSVPSSSPVATTSVSQEISESPKMTPEKLAFLQSKEEIQQLFFIAEQYLGKTLDSMEISMILYFYDGLKFSSDLIEYLVEYCVSRGCGNCRYMETVALSWAKEGIHTVEQAKQNVLQYTKNYFSILRAFGIRGRNPIDSEIEYMSRWLKEFELPLDLILEACRRTIERIHQPKFSYTEKILKDWKDNGIQTVEQMKSFEEQQKQKRPIAVSSASSGFSGSSGSSVNRFNNFHQRKYDYTQLEKLLLDADRPSEVNGRSSEEKNTFSHHNAEKTDLEGLI